MFLGDVFSDGRIRAQRQRFSFHKKEWWSLGGGKSMGVSDESIGWVGINCAGSWTVEVQANRSKLFECWEVWALSTGIKLLIQIGGGGKTGSEACLLVKLLTCLVPHWLLYQLDVTGYVKSTSTYTPTRFKGQDNTDLYMGPIILQCKGDTLMWH